MNLCWCLGFHPGRLEIRMKKQFFAQEIRAGTDVVWLMVKLHVGQKITGLFGNYCETGHWTPSPSN